MKSKPLVTVIMPIYNCESFIQEAIQSILNQTYDFFEFLIIDDCSTDNTLQIANSFQDSRIVIIEKEKNTGYTNSLNYGLSIAKGKYIARMDGDDISLPERFAKQVSFMEANLDVVVCGSAYSIIGIEKLINVPENHDAIKVGLLQECKFGHPTVMLRKSILVDNEIKYDCELEPVEDYDLWVRLSLIGKLHNLQEYLLKYRIHNAQISNVSNKQQVKNAKYTRLKLLTFLKADIITEQKEVYLKAIDAFEKISYPEFLILLQLKKDLIKTNRIGFFNKVAFEKYWAQLELKFNGHYFKNRSSYSILILKQYIFIYKKLSNRLNAKELFKMVVKSLINYKVK